LAFEKEGSKEKLECTFIPAKEITRQTYILDVIRRNAGIWLQRSATEEGLPLRFNVKDLVAKGSGVIFQRSFTLSGHSMTPLYLTGLFPNPKGRSATIKYYMDTGERG
jgi:hypothetical protein